MAHPHRRDGRGHPLISPCPLRRVVALAGVCLATAFAAAPQRNPPPQVKRFLDVWKRAGGQHREAVAAFDKFAQQEPWAADLAAYGRARAVAAHDPVAGRALHDSLGTALAGTEIGRRAHIHFVRSWLAATSVLDTADLLLMDRFLSMRLPSDLRHAVATRRLKLLAMAGDTARLLRGAVDLATEGPEPPVLRELRSLLARGFPDLLRDNDFRHALAGAWFAADRPDTAWALFDSLAVAGWEMSTDDRVVQGRILLDLGRVNEAIASFRLGATDPRSENALLWLGRGLERVGRPDDAQGVFLEYARRWPGSGKGQEILWGKGMDAEKAGDCVEAADWFQRVRQGGGRRSEWARFREGYCWYRQKEWAKAHEILARERLLAKGTMREASWYFDAAALRNLGDTLGADSLLRSLARIAPWSFHGHLARRAVGLEQALVDSLERQPDSVAGRPVPVAWASDSPPALLRGDSLQLLRALIARAIGEETIWKAELDATDRAVRGSGIRELGLILWMRSLGMDNEAMPRVRRLLSRMSTDEMARAPKALLKMFYPMHFLEDIKPHLRGDSVIDAGFVHAVMRQESGFDPWARSSAGAVGLLQLIPPTAKAMASKTGLGGFQVSQLVDPAVNLRLGIAYLRELERIWGGQPALILANYNAGPSPTLRWREAFRTMPVEEAAEEITYWETRDYVKKCLANWWTYRLLYPEMR